MRSIVRAFAAASLAALAALAALSAACSSPSNDHPPILAVATFLDSGVTSVPDAAVCNAAPIDSTNLPSVGGCFGPVTRIIDGCVEWHAAGPYDYTAQARIDCAAGNDTWYAGGCPRMGAGGYCAYPFTGAASACPVTQWGYYYPNASGADDVYQASVACETQWGGTWTAL